MPQHPEKEPCDVETIIENFYKKECEVRWKEGFMNVVCGASYPCRQHTSEQEYKSAIRTLLTSTREEALEDSEIEESVWFKAKVAMILEGATALAREDGKKDVLKELIMEHTQNQLEGKGYDFYFAIRTKLDALADLSANIK